MTFPVQPAALTVVDVDGDGHLDVVAPLSDGTVAIVMGTGGGAVSAAQFFVAGFNPSSITTADFNDDGHLDLVIGFRSGVAILFGNGDGTFQAPVVYASDSTVVSVAVGDIDGDGHTDVVFDFDNYNVRGVSVLLNDGTGALGPQRTFVAGNDPASVTLGDFDGDGHLDALVASGEARMYFLRGDGVGRFVASGFLPDGFYLTHGDFDGDGKEDLIQASSTVPGGLLFLAGTGDRDFRASVPAGVASNDGIFALVVGDFNGDGHEDLVTRGSASVQIALGKGDGTFLAPVKYSLGGFSSGGALVVGDWNHDGKLDVAVSDAGDVVLFLGNGNGTLQPGYPAGLGFAAYQLATADMDGDGKLDLVAESTNQFGSAGDVQIAYGDGAGHFAAGPSLISGTYAVIVGDFDEDGVPDIAATVSGKAQVVLLFGNGDGTFRPPVYLGLLGAPIGLIAEDFDGDGHVDLATVAGSDVSLLLGIGNGHFQSPEDYPLGVQNVGAIAAGEFRKGGGLDVIAGGSVLLWNRKLAVVQPPATTGACLGSSVTFRAKASGYGSVSYRWKKNGSPLSDGGSISGSGTGVLTIGNVSAGDAASYTVGVSDSCMSLSSAAAGLGVDAKPAVPAITVAASVPPNGANATASVPADVGHTFAWSVTGGTLVSGQGIEPDLVCRSRSGEQGHTLRLRRHGGRLRLGARLRHRARGLPGRHTLVPLPRRDRHDGQGGNHEGVRRRELLSRAARFPGSRCRYSFCVANMEAAISLRPQLEPLFRTSPSRRLSRVGWKRQGRRGYRPAAAPEVLLRSVPRNP